jgi:hypothetical protein
MNGNNGKKGLKWLIYMILGGFLIKLFRFIFKGDNEKKLFNNLKDFFKKQKKEVKQLAEGDQSFKEYCKDSSSIFKNYFIPNDCNDFKPKILRTKTLAIIAIALLIVKMSVTGYLFFIYPNLARMTAMIQDEIYSLVNSERQTNDIAVLGTNEVLNKVAKAKADDMISKNYFAHKSSDGKMIWDMISRDEYPYLYVGENLAMNFTSAQSAHKALMLSETHKKNILNLKYTEIGVAVVPGEINNKKTNVLVQVFAHAKVASTPIVRQDTPSTPVESQVSPSIVDESQVLSAEESITTEPEKTENPIPTAPTTIEQERQAVAEPAEELAPNLNRDLRENILAATAIEIPNKNGTAIKAINYSQYIFIGALALLIIALLVNILVRISIQHKPVIVQTLLVIVFVYGLITIKFHFLESITESILVM